MIEIKFRGKDKLTSKWLYGSLINNAFQMNDKSPCCYIFDHDQFPGYDCWEDIAGYIDDFEVIPETVGQFTGLLDKNGKEIYEGDIIVHLRWDRPYSEKRKSSRALCVVEWNTGDKADVGLNPQKLVNPSLFNTEPGFVGRLIDGLDGFYDWSEFHDCEVLGNIHKHPHLLSPSKDKP